MNQKQKKYFWISLGIAAALLILQLFMQGVLYINSVYTFFRVVGDSFVVVTIILFALWLFAMAWYNGLFDAFTFLKDGANKMHLENGRIQPKKTIREYGEEKAKVRTKPVYLLRVWLITLVPAVVLSLLAIIMAS